MTVVRGSGGRPEETGDGAAPGFRPSRSLRISVELRRQLLRGRTALVAACAVLLPVVLIVSFGVGDPPAKGPTPDYEALAAESTPNFVMYVMFVAGTYLNGVLVALLVADGVASEAAYANLKYLLAIPVPRLRLLWRKAAVSALLSAVVVTLVPLVAVAAGALSIGAGNMTTPTGYTLPFGEALVVLALAELYVVVQLSWLAGLSLLLTASTDVPLGAVGGAVLASMFGQILDQVTALGSLREFLPSHYTWTWMELLSPEPDLRSLADGVLVSIAYACVFGTLAAFRFSRKDITS
ncbi:ABC transporter permease [Umezawaea beigongshangensis]|uniref:ABC transporter permease n=1 Tax=Umezawaea beigongshangensis TaxID=2780383 RepID=UPI0018F219E7|nr:ABC transporter permease [Umezawaea beigongshangensis]